MKIDIINTNRQKVSEIEVNDRVLNEPGKDHLVYDAVRMHLACRRRGTAETKERSLVSGGGKKPWKQKGTGRARSGSTRSPLWRGGGKVFGPHPRSYSFRLPQKVRQEALRSVLATKFQEKKMLVLESLEMPEIKTGKFHKTLRGMGVSDALIVLDGHQEGIEKSARNVPGIQIALVDNLNIHDIMRHEHLIFLRSSWEKMERKLQP